jgi:hypothetical protein
MQPCPSPSAMTADCHYLVHRLNPPMLRRIAKALGLLVLS